MDKEEIKERVRLAIKNRPTTIKMIKSASVSIARWAKNGFTKVSQNKYNERMSICRACEYWKDSLNMGMGKCLKCGCSKGKMWIPHEQCPIGLWGKEPLT